MSLSALDFNASLPLAVASTIGVFLPLFLLPITRAPTLRSRNPLQFLLGVAATVAIWIAVIALFPSARPVAVSEYVLCLMAIAGAALFYLEVWALMSRGYTLAVLQTLLEKQQPLSAAEIRALYRNGDGLDWILRHRLHGMVAARIIEQHGDHFILTPVRGVIVAKLHRVAVAVLGLTRTG